MDIIEKNLHDFWYSEVASPPQYFVIILNSLATFIIVTNLIFNLIYGSEYLVDLEKKPKRKNFICLILIPSFICIIKSIVLADSVMFKNENPAKELLYWPNEALALAAGIIFGLNAILARKRFFKFFDGFVVFSWLLFYLSIATRFLSANLMLAKDKFENKSLFTVLMVDFVISTISFLVMLFVSEFDYSDGETKYYEEYGASLFSRLYYTWIYSFIYRASQHNLSDANTFDLHEREDSRRLSRKIKSTLKTYLSPIKTKNSHSKFLLTKSVYKSHFVEIILISFSRIENILFNYATPNLIRLILITYSSTQYTNKWQRYYGALFFTGFQLLTFSISGYTFNMIFKFNRRVTAAIYSIVYEKITDKENRRLINDSDFAEISSILSSDIVLYAELTTFLMILISSAFQITVFTINGYSIASYSIFVGAGVLVFIVAVFYRLISCNKSYQRKMLKCKDARLGKMTEFINGFKIIKLYAWENFFENQISKLRLNEINELFKAFLTSILMRSEFFLTSNIFSLVTYAVFANINPENLKPENTIPLLSIVLGYSFKITTFPGILQRIINAFVAENRIVKFLEKYESTSYLLDSDFAETTCDKDNSKIALEIYGNFSWTGDFNNSPENFMLNDIDIKIEQGKLVAIVGKVGNGKSAIFSAILKEMYGDSKSILNINGSLSLATQQPWLWSRSIMENILMFSGYDQAKYDEIIHSCCLEEDLSQFIDGDQTLAGQAGYRFSGGQQQRINLARCAYRDADIYLFDDPLSAVDPKVQIDIFQRLLSNEAGYLSKKTRLVITNSEKIAQLCDKIIVIDSGRIIMHDIAQKVIENPDIISKYLTPENESTISTNFEKHTLKYFIEMPALPSVDNSDSMVQSYNDLTTADSSASGLSRKSFKTNEESGSMTKYFQSFPAKNIALFAVFFLISVSISSFAYYAFNNINRPFSGLSSQDMVYLWGGLLVGNSLIQFTYNFILMNGSVIASGVMYTRLLTKFSKWTLKAVETFTNGKILNVFAKDLYNYDYTLLINLFEIIPMTELLIYSFANFAIDFPWFLVIGIAILILYMLVQTYYIFAIQQILNFEIKAFGPILTQISETCKGLQIIKIFECESQMQEIFNQSLNSLVRWYTYKYHFFRWLPLQLNFLLSFMNLGVFIAYIIPTFDNEAERGEKLGFFLSFSERIFTGMLFITINLSLFQSNLVSFKRLNAFLKVKTELNWKKASGVTEATSNDSNDTTFQNSSIKFQNYSFRYESSLVLKNINCDFKSGEKILVCGRTGCGKSTFVSSLFRMRDPKLSKGEIFIGGKNIRRLPLQQLRSQLTIIPQTPMLFDNSLRENLDPVGEHSDDKLWNVLEKIEMKKHFELNSKGLDAPCSDSSLSVGQKQLLCLGRAILKNSKVVILDESTSSLDEITAQKINSYDFGSDVTIISIAHRISNFLHFDRVLVLEDGEIIQNDTMQEAVNNKSSVFSEMLEAEFKK